MLLSSENRSDFSLVKSALSNPDSFAPDHAPRPAAEIYISTYCGRSAWRRQPIVRLPIRLTARAEPDVRRRARGAPWRQRAHADPGQQRQSPSSIIANFVNITAAPKVTQNDPVWAERLNYFGQHTSLRSLEFFAANIHGAA